MSYANVDMDVCNVLLVVELVFYLEGVFKVAEGDSLSSDALRG